MTDTRSPLQRLRLRMWGNELLATDKAQGLGYLLQCNDGIYSYCCLGIASEVAIANGLPVQVSEEAALKGQRYGYDQESARLPASVQKWYGIDADPIVGIEPLTGEEVGATTANDHLRWNFQRIGQAIIDYYDLHDVNAEVAADLRDNTENR